MKRYFFLAIAAIIALALGMASCSTTELDNTPYSDPVSNLDYSKSKKDITITWVSPSGADELAIFKDASQVTTVPASTTSYTFKNVMDGNTHVFTVKAIYKEANRMSEGKSVTIDCSSDTKAAFLLTDVSDYNDLTDDDEFAAAKYFQKKFVDANTGVFVKGSEVASLEIEKVPVIWVMIDRVGLGNTSAAITSILGQSTVDALKDYVKRGGNLYLSNHATMLATGIGRTPYEVTCFDSGEGGTHDDIWSAITILGFSMGTPYDRSDHDIFKGIATDNYNGWTQKTIALQGSGSDENHNCFWIPADIPGRTWGDNDNVSTIPDYEAALTCKILAGWGHVVNYCVGGITEFLPTDTYKGTVLCNGLAAYEFHQDKPSEGTENKYQTNIEMLTSNSINYLK